MPVLGIGIASAVGAPLAGSFMVLAGVVLAVLGGTAVALRRYPSAVALG